MLTDAQWVMLGQEARAPSYNNLESISTLVQSESYMNKALTHCNSRYKTDQYKHIHDHIY